MTNTNDFLELVQRQRTDFIKKSNKARKKLWGLFGSRHKPQSAAQLEKLNDELLQAFSEIGFGPSYLDYTQNIEIGWIRDRQAQGDVCGLKLKNKDVLVSDVIRLLQEAPIPQVIKDKYPELSPEEWEAITSIAFMVFSSLEEETD